MQRTTTNHPIGGKLIGKTHQLHIRVYYEDTDFTGIVYHANYLRFAERARSNFLRAANMPHQKLLKLNPPITFAITRMNIRFLKPAHIDELLTIHTQLIKLGKASFDMSQTISRNSTKLFHATLRAAAINQHNQPQIMPPNLTKNLQKLLITTKT